MRCDLSRAVSNNADPRRADVIVWSEELTQASSDAGTAVHHGNRDSKRPSCDYIRRRPGLIMARFASLENQINYRFDELRDLWRAELRRLEHVLDTRLKHLGQR